MNFFKQKTNILFLFIIFLLVAALSGVSYFSYEKHNDYVAVSSALSDNNSKLNEAQKKIDELNQKIENYDSDVILSEQEKAELRSQLQAALDEKARLEGENSSLKAEIEQLMAKRNELQDSIRLNLVNQADTAEGGICYLTFDDGPSNNTLKILDILDTYGIKATFFVVGTARTEYIPQIVNRGHAIGLHSATHKYDVIYKNVNNYLSDIKHISDIVYEKTGIRTNIMRFPGGSSNKISAQYRKGIMTDLTDRMTSLGYSYFDWNVVSGDADASVVPAETIATNVLSRARGKNSICVLMHDTEKKTTTVEALPTIIEGLSAMGFRFAPLTAESYGFHQTVGN
ncbi:MAG: polysaccharide deacetylase family protein [Clostridia bacterium]|nr:polysaccharide deacetylase family protein [Clostridia bacterium]